MIRRMAGGTAVRNISDDDAVIIIEGAEQQVEERSGIPSSDLESYYDLRLKAKRLFAAAEMASRFADMEPQVRMWLDMANSICDSLSTVDTGDISDANVLIGPTEDAQYIRDWRAGWRPGTMGYNYNYYYQYQ